MGVLNILAKAAKAIPAKTASLLESIKNVTSTSKDLPYEKLLTASEKVDGLFVRQSVPDMGSISVTLSNYKILPGLKEVDFRLFSGPDNLTPRTKNLMGQIQESGEINPLIVVFDKKGPYILEGAHRYDALQHLGKTKFPAKVVVDLD